MKKSRRYQLPTNNELTTNHYSLTTTIATALNDCPPGTLFLASVSGGADSTAMLAALASIRDAQSGFELRCIHVEHGIRPAAESRGDAEFVRSLCNTLRVPCHVTSIKPGKVAALAKKRGIGIEAAARLYRRRAWYRHLRRLETEGQRPQTRPPSVRILVAHTADDMRETALMRILRGSGPSGLAAMPASRGRILRPLMSLSRRDVLEYLSKKNITWREDSTNTNTQFLRNRIRRLLIPHLDEHFPQWRGAIAALAKTQSLTAAFIRKEAVHRVKWGVGIEHSKHGVLLSRADYKQQPYSPFPKAALPPPHSLYTDTENFFSQPAIIREEALFQGINRLGIPAKIKRANIRRFAEGSLTAVDLGQLQIRHDSHNVTIGATEKDDFDPLSTTHYPLPTNHYFSLLINAPGSYNLKGIAIEVANCDPADCYSDVFLGLLPLVFRPSFGEFPGAIMVAEDFRGIAAFIGPGGLLQCGESRDRKGRAVWITMTRVSGSGASRSIQNEGIDVQRQK
jgi:tRNA(Ile)-lysidine synthase